uniref:RING-type E3 ubiquitin transferase n=1 Tax=Sphenodon punctatus TaxID=8508 RepID=A0A8D0GLN8_SPHPU
MAAAAQKSESFWDEATCSICLEYFTDPVSIPCGHSFCRACIDRCWGESETNFSCPQCRDTAQQRNLRPCRELGSLVERVKELKLQVEKELEEGPGLCERHREPLKLFCEEDQAPICLVCDRAKEHRDHRVLPIEEATQDYKNQIQDRMNSADAERERLQGWKRYTGSISQCHLVSVQGYCPTWTWGAFLTLHEGH